MNIPVPNIGAIQMNPIKQNDFLENGYNDFD
jgi:hypothetical protein